MFHANLVCCLFCVCVYVCAFVRVVVMCVMNEPTPRNIPCTCYLVKIKFLISYVIWCAENEGFNTDVHVTVSYLWCAGNEGFTTHVHITVSYLWCAGDKGFNTGVCVTVS